MKLINKKAVTFLFITKFIAIHDTFNNDIYYNNK
jgi:hypothetical protein